MCAGFWGQGLGFGGVKGWGSGFRFRGLGFGVWGSRLGLPTSAQ